MRYWRAWCNTKSRGHLGGDETFFVPGAPSACADFCDPVAIFRLKTCGWVSGEGLIAGPSLFNGRPRSRSLAEISDRHEDVLV